MSYKLSSAIYRYYPAIAAALIVLAGIGGFWLYRNLQPHYRTERLERVSYRYRGTFEHRAEVAENNQLWPVGEVLENRSAYFLHVTPKLEVDFRYELSRIGSARGDLMLDADLEISSGGEEVDYWREIVDLRETSRGLSERSATLNLEIDVPRIMERIENIRESLRFAGGSTEIRTIVTATMDGEIDGRRVDNTATYELPIDVGRSTYLPGSDLSREETVMRTVVRRVREEVPLTRKVLPLALIIAPMLVLGYVSLEWREVDESELEELEREHERAKYDEWVSGGKLPDLDFETTVEMESLKDLVDASVDMGSRVIYDEGKSTYYFIHEGILYSYAEAKYDTECRASKSPEDEDQ